MKMGAKKGHRRWYIGGLAAFVVATVMVVGLDRYHSAPLALTARAESPSLMATGVKGLDWPAYGQAAVATRDYGVLATHGATAPQPTASTAKLITAVAILRAKPYADGRGATITFAPADVASYRAYVAGGGTVAAVTDGLQWTQHQALQAVMLASANNVSDTLAIWAFGSLAAYRDYAQAMVEELGMHDTTIGSDASGYSATTKSTAHDLALLAGEALRHQPLREIVGMQTVTLPVAGTITNTNRLLSDPAILGMKTGWIPEAGGVFVLAASQELEGQTHEIITVVMGAPGGASRQAQDAAYRLYQSARDEFSYRTIVSEGQELGGLAAPWREGEVPLVATRDIGAIVWGGQTPEVRVSIDDVTAPREGQAGLAQVSLGDWHADAPLRLAEPIAPPSAWWRVVGRGF